MSTPELWQPEWLSLNYADLYFMGRLSMSGVALPNSPGLNVPSLEVTDPADPAVQREIGRMVAAMDGIARIPGTQPVGLEHSQLKPSADAPRPLQLILVPAGIDGARTEITIGGNAFQCLVNTVLDVPRNLAGGGNLIKEGCFSSGPFSVVTKRPGTVLATAQNRYGGQLAPLEVSGYSAAVLQHEVFGHSAGGRAADESDRIRNWVPRDQIDEYRKLSPGQINRWPIRASYAQWRAFSRQQDYPYFPTDGLEEAFWAGREAQRLVLLH